MNNLNEEKFSHFTITNIKVDWDEMCVSEEENNEESWKGVGKGWVIKNGKIYINSTESGEDDELTQIVFLNEKGKTLEELYDEFEPFTYCDGPLFHMFGLFVEGFKIIPLSDEKVKSIDENPINIRYFVDVD